MNKKEAKISAKELQKLAMNSAQYEWPVYRGFVDEGKEDLVTYDFGETLVMLAPMGEFQGWNSAKQEPIEENIDVSALNNILMNYNGEELLVDIDHRSMKDPSERDTQAAGWVSELTAVIGVGDLDGLYGKIRWTDIGKQLVEARTYRFLSPVFEVDEDGRPSKLLNVALTNRPALNKMSPILNTEAVAQNDFTKEYLDMTKDELIEVVNACVDEKIKAMNACTEETKEETSAENACGDETKEEVATSEASNEAPVEETKEEVKEEVKEEIKEEIKEEAAEAAAEKPAEEAKEDKEDEKEDEIIKEEVLNSVPNTVEQKLEEWKNLRGKAFIDWLQKHPTGV